MRFLDHNTVLYTTEYKNKINLLFLPSTKLVQSSTWNVAYSPLDKKMQ